MATMIPDRIPEAYLDDPGHRAEREMFEAFCDELDARYEVYGWVPLLNARPGHGQSQFEVDFLLAHPERGVLALEVKGGTISHDGASDLWFSDDRMGTRHEIKNPFRQADEARFAVRERLHLDGRMPNVTDGYAVAFPDVRAPRFDLGADAPRDLLLTAEDFARLPARIEQLFGYWARQQGGVHQPGVVGMQGLRRQFAHSFELEPALVAEFRRQRRTIERLTEQQYAVLQRAARARRVLVTGGAGTGKTLLAVDRARRHALGGLSTLLVCFNRPLAAHLRALTADVEGLEVATVHERFHALASRLDPALPGIDAATRLPGASAFFLSTLPERYADALTRFPEARVDAIVVDEGQDLCDMDRIALELTLAEPTFGFLTVFQDEGQAVYPERHGWSDDGYVRLALEQNLRNSAGVSACLRVLSPAHAARAAGPAGPAPELIEASDERGMRDAVARVLHRYVHDQGVPPELIAVLTASRDEFPRLERDGAIGAFRVTHALAGERGCVLLECVTRFKGLEREVVILTALADKPYLDAAALRYVGASRASQRLIVVERREVLEHFRGGPC